MDNALMTKIRDDDMGGPISKSRALVDGRAFLIGLGLPVQQGAWTFSDFQTSTTWRWKYLADIARMADRGGFDYLFFGSQYFPPGGYNGLHRTHSLEAVELAASIAAITDNIFLIPTMSATGESSPVYFSRVMATLDHISNGRAGVNLMPNLAVGDIGETFRDKKDLNLRYKIADEFLEVVKRLWTEDTPLNYEGSFFQVYDGYISPKPLQKPFPMLMSADMTDESGKFLSDHCQMRFIARSSHIGSDDAALRDLMKVRASALQYIVCRETTSQAEAASREICDQFNPNTLAGHAKKFGHGSSSAQLEPSHALGGNITLEPIIGAPKDIVESLIALKEKGVGAIQITFADYAKELPFFIDQVMPLIRDSDLQG